MKYQKTFYAVCATIFLVTLALIVVFVLTAFKVIQMTTFHLLVVCVATLVMLFMCFVCGCILATFYDDWKARRVNSGAKWRR